MQCPVDQTTLNVSERQGVEIDWCPTCRGVWLGRGELDEIVERSAAELAPRPTPSLDRTTGVEHHHLPKPKKRTPFLQELVEGMGE
jgi:hypothetical protein